MLTMTTFSIRKMKIKNAKMCWPSIFTLRDYPVAIFELFVGGWNSSICRSHVESEDDEHTVAIAIYFYRNLYKLYHEIYDIDNTALQPPL